MKLMFNATCRVDNVGATIGHPHIKSKQNDKLKFESF